MKTHDCRFLLQKLATDSNVALMAEKHFRIKKYKSSNRPNLKFVVRSNVAGKWERRFFETQAEAKTYAAQKEIELLNQGTEGMNFPTELRVMAQRASQLLSQYGK